MSEFQIEIIGYVASFFVAISFLFKNITTIRWINLIGCAVFILYGSLINSLPVIFTNSFIVIVQVYYLFFYKSKKEVSAS